MKIKALTSIINLYRSIFLVFTLLKTENMLVEYLKPNLRLSQTAKNFQYLIFQFPPLLPMANQIFKTSE